MLSNYFRQYIAGIYCRKFLTLSNKIRVTKASALELLFKACLFYIYFKFRWDILHANSQYPDKLPHFVSSELVMTIEFYSVSHKKDVILILRHIVRHSYPAQLTKKLEHQSFLRDQIRKHTAAEIFKARMIVRSVAVRMKTIL